MANQDQRRTPQRAAKKPEPPTTGHEWDGIREFDNPMPRWWLWTFYITIIWAVIYMILYPAWPLVTRATGGVLGYSSRGDVAAEIARFDQGNQVWFNRLLETELSEIHNDPELQSFAVNAGAAVFRAQCSQCHGSGGAGVQASGYPNLLDDEWLWGGQIEEIELTVAYGIRNEDHADARWSVMPAFGVDEILTGEEIDQTVNYVLRMSQQPHDPALAAAGAEVFANNCSSCHGEAGGGDPFLGAPALNNAIWLYGGSAEDIRHSIYYSRFGVMPGFSGRIRDGEIRAVAAYVHQLGGGQ